MAGLTLTLVRAVGKNLPNDEKIYSDVTYARERGERNSIYITLRRPSHKTSVDYLNIGAGLEVTMTALPFDANMSIEFCGPTADAYVAQLADLEHISGMPRILTPILKGELNKLQLS